MARDLVAKYGTTKHTGMATYNVSYVRKAENIIYGVRAGVVLLFVGFLTWMFFVANTFAWVLGISVVGLGGGYLLVRGIMKLTKAYSVSRRIVAHAKDYGVKDE